MKTAPTLFKHHFALATLFVSLLCVLCGKSSAQDFKTIHPGVEYAHVEYRIGNDPQKINLLRLDLTKVRLDVHHAFDKAIGVEPTSTIAARHGAVAAINAGFFRLDKSVFAGDASGILKIDSVTLSESMNDRIALLISNLKKRTEVYFGWIRLDERISSKRMSMALSGLNRERKDNEVIRYTPEFARTTLTDSNGVEVTVRKGRVVAILDRTGRTPIPADGYVLSASGSLRERLMSELKLGQKINLLTAPTVDNLGPDQPYLELLSAYSTADDIVGGVSRLLRKGSVALSWEQEKASKSFAETRHPRTAVARLKDGKFLMITVDGRQAGVSVGMNLRELAEYLLSLGAIDAMNLDGGGSTTMFVDGKVVNTPSDKEGERKVSDAIVVTLRKNARR
jgi:hypothetical protein